MLESFKATKDAGLERLYVLLNAANGFVDQAKKAKDLAKEIYEKAISYETQYNDGIATIETSATQAEDAVDIA